jgi:PAS domain S-box-containing protein
MDMSTLLPFLTQNFASATQCEGVAVYLQVDGYFKKQFDHRRHPASLFETPDRPPSSIIDLLQETREVISLTQMTAGHLPEHRLDSYKDFAPLNWSLILPLVSEDAVIGAIAIGPKLSGDPFYPQDLDLLTTLANQAGIAIKNAQLYAEVVLANEYIENIVATINSGVVAINPAGRITMFNRAAEQLTDLTSDAVASQPVTILPERLGAALMLAVHDGHPVTQPEIALPGGTVTRPVICTTSPLRDASGAILGAVAVFSDLTPLKELEIERRRAEKLAYFEALASGLAHEIKNPLVAIKTFAQLFPRRYMDEKFATDFGPKVTREIERMERLVERLQTLARPSERPHRPLDLRVPLREAVEFMQPVLDEKGLTLVTGLGEMPTIILGEHDELKQLILNLLMNAHEATPPGGTVIVELAATATDATVTVADAGPGIPAELLERVFDPFFTTKRRGTGLGLAICSGIADAHRAKLRAANRATGGALMTVEFPLAKTATTEVMT